MRSILRPFVTRLFRSLAYLPLAALLVTVVGAPPSSGAVVGYKVVVNAANPATSLSREQLSSYFLRKSEAWPAGDAVGAVDLEKASPARAAFSREVLKKSIAEVTAYWQRQIFAGRAVPPPEKRSDAEVVAYVEGHRGGIGYVSEGAPVGDAKVVSVVE